jgi:hypothetical protein
MLFPVGQRVTSGGTRVYQPGIRLCGVETFSETLDFAVFPLLACGFDDKLVAPAWLATVFLAIRPVVGVDPCLGSANCI